MEDLGDIDLWSLRNASWTARKDLYQKTLVAAHRLHSFPGPRFPYDRVKLMEACGPSFYRWERDYFKCNFIEALCEIRLEADWEQKLEAELAGLEKRLLSYRQSLIHRDLQSQNVMIWEEEPFFIDFQGMRFGTPFYDLGSFLCDPYVSISETERMELLSYYYELLHPETDWNSFQTAFWEASAQRLMQALGAYGFLGIKKRLKDYLKHVPRGLRNLVKAAGEARGLPTLLEICARCESALAKSNSRFEIRD
jgi:aminoglycoside/choline kinase family phosphotransferase